MSALVRGAKGSAVLALQTAILALDADALPRWGADGALGTETLEAVDRLLVDHRGPGIAADGEVSREEAETLEALAARAQEPRPIDAELRASGRLVDLTADPRCQANRRRRRAWVDVRGITLHQTATEIGDRAEVWPRVAVHVGVSRTGKIYLLSGPEWVTWHGNALNAQTIGIELDGHYEGIEGKPRTYWRPEGSTRKPQTPTPELIEGGRLALRWLAEHVRAHGGKLSEVWAHRQSSSSRQSDPGSRLWQEVGLWAQRELGLISPRRAIGGGLPIPEAWDSSRLGVEY